MNMQGVCDSKMRFYEISLRAGSCNDKSLFNLSTFSKELCSIMPRGLHLLGDSGYSLREVMMTPYDFNSLDNFPTRKYNKVHAQTRGVIERAFGQLKCRWRILKGILAMKTPESVARTIAAAVVLHNLSIDFNDDTILGDEFDDYCGVHRHVESETIANMMHNLERGSRKRDMIRDFLVQDGDI